MTEFDLLGVTFAVDLDKMIDLSYSNIVKVEKELKIWKRRYLTPIGKITVLKTLILPQFNHIFMSIRNPKIILIKELNNMFYKCIWEDKYARPYLLCEGFKNILVCRLYKIFVLHGYI